MFFPSRISGSLCGPIQNLVIRRFSLCIRERHIYCIKSRSRRIFGPFKNVIIENCDGLYVARVYVSKSRSANIDLVKLEDFYFNYGRVEYMKMSVLEYSISKREYDSDSRGYSDGRKSKLDLACDTRYLAIPLATA